MNPSLSRRGLALAATVFVFGGVIAAVAYQGAKKEDAPAKKDANTIATRNPKEWPLFGGTVSRNLINLVDKNIPQEFDVDKGKAGNIRWMQNLGSKAYGGPVVAGGKIFMGTNNGQPRDPKIKGDKGVLMCFDAATGKFEWQKVYDKLAAGRVNDWPEEGICSSPFVEGDRLYFVNNRSEITCASTDNKTIHWKLDMMKQLDVFPHNLSTCSPLVVGDTLFVITSNGVDEGHINIPKPASPSFLAINKKDGKVKWSSNLPSIELLEAQKTGKAVNIEAMKNKGEILMHGQWSNPVYAEPDGKPVIIFPGGDGWMRGYDPAGDKAGGAKLLWQFDCNPKSSFYVLGPKATRNDFVSTPVVWENKLYIGVGQDPEHLKGVGHFWCIDLVKAAEKGAVNKNHDVSPYSDPKDPNPKFDPKDPKNKDSALVWHFGGMREKPKKGERPYLFGRTMSTCSVVDGLLYEGEFDGWLHCLDARTGQQYWEHNMEADSWSSPYYVDGKIYLGNEVGQVFVFKAGKKKEVLNTIDTGASYVRATPIVANGVMYVVTENPCRLYAVTTGGK